MSVRADRSAGGKILVGTSSWTDKSLIDSGRFYPASAKKPEDRLRYYASQFPIVEIDSSYYGIPVEANARLWVERTPPEFVSTSRRIGSSRGIRRRWRASRRRCAPRLARSPRRTFTTKT